VKLLFFRGIGGDNGEGNYYTQDIEFARQFTFSGRDSEILKKYIDAKYIYTLNPLPRATNEDEIDNAISEAQEKGYKAITVNEGQNMPNSLFVFDKSLLK